MCLMPLISVILPTRDRSSLLPRAVQSVLAQTETSFELLVIDQNVLEPPVVERHRGAAWLGDGRLKVLAGGPVRSAAAARNRGLAMAVGEWISYLDDDDSYHPEKLARQRALAESTGAPLVLCGAAYHLRG